MTRNGASATATSVDGLKFVNPGDAGGDKTYEGFKAGT
jgi:hypothetical protein